MATISRDYNILISVDVGYDKSKITINGQTYWVPRAIYDITGNDNFIANMKEKSFLEIEYIKGQKQLIGAQARTQMSKRSNKEKNLSKVEIANTFEYFASNDSIYHLMGSIGYAFIKYEESKVDANFSIGKLCEPNSPYSIWLILGYPNDISEKTFGMVKPNVCKHHKFKLQTCNREVVFDFEIKSENAMGYSQALAAFMGIISDDKGELKTKLPKLPAVVVDGGQFTTGIYRIAENYRVEVAESNTVYAMNNVYERVVDDIKDKYNRDDIIASDINEILSSNKGIINYLDENDETQSVDIKPLVDKYIVEVSDELKDYLNNKFNNFIEEKSIFFVGGTGAAFYPRFKEYVDQKRKTISQNTILVDYEFNGKPIDPVNAVTIGLYKILKHSVAVYTNSLKED